MSTFSEPMKPFIAAKLSRLKSASRGATISLINEGNTYAAYLADAVAAQGIAGPNMGAMQDVGDILTESVPIFRIPYNQMSTFLKLAESKASVALLDTDTNGTTNKIECIYYQAKKAIPIDDILGDLL